jgi:hypothetical protein
VWTGPGRRLTLEQQAVSVALSVKDFAARFAVSPAVVRGWVVAGLPCLRFSGKLSILRVEGDEWVRRRFAHDRVTRVVDEVLADLTTNRRAS